MPGEGVSIAGKLPPFPAGKAACLCTTAPSCNPVNVENIVKLLKKIFA
jgi:hypothetical protein